MSNLIRSNLLTLNPNQTVSIQRVGLEQHLVVIVDDFYQYSEEILQVALGLPYTDRFEIVRNFPGVRARLDLDHRELVESMSAILGCPLFTFSSPQPVVFQGIKTDNYRLNVGQRQPHIDQESPPWSILILQILVRGEPGYTAIDRQVSNGYH